MEYTISTHEDFAESSDVVGPYESLFLALADAKDELGIKDNDSFWVEGRTVGTEPDGTDTVYTLEKHVCRPFGSEWLSIRELQRYSKLPARKWRYWCRNGIIPEKWMRQESRFWFVHAEAISSHCGAAA